MESGAAVHHWSMQAEWIKDIHATFALKRPTNNAFCSTMGMKEADTNVEACVVL